MNKIINNFITINPGCNLSGNAIIENACKIVTGFKVIQGINIEVNNNIGAGSIIIRAIEDSSKYVEVLTKKMEIKK